MIYLSRVRFPDVEVEYSFVMGQKRTCYDSFYPFQVLSKRNFRQIDFEPITILYGGNGTGKTTALNVIAERIEAKRDAVFNRTNFYGDYVRMCEIEVERDLPLNTRIITSDDVFDYMLNIRSLNEGIHEKREELFDEYMEAKYSHFQMNSMADYEQLKKVNQARSKTQSKYVRNNLMNNVREHSNGESAFLFFTERMEEQGLYLLDEPENSLSPDRQLELVQYIEDSVRYYNCQLIISTHSPFLLAMKGAKIYDLDEDPVDVKRWTELANVRTYYDFFKKHDSEF